VPRVLIPTDEPNFTLGLVQGYRSLGWDVTTGATNFNICAAHYDLIHFQWPEEYCGWRPPTEDDIANIEQNLRWWNSQSKTVFSVHNLYPHNGVGHPAYHKLYSAFYQHCNLISHFSQASQRSVVDEFSSAKQARHVVHCPPNYDVTLVRQRQRGSRRAEMGIGEDEFVILVIGRLRSWDELKLIQTAFDLAKVPRKRLLMAGKFALIEPPFRRRLHSLRWNLWLKRRRAVVDTRYVPEDEISQFLDSCDIIIVPRLAGLNSAIIFLAMTFGRMIIAPNLNSYAEQLAGSRNFLYQPGHAKSCARQLERAAALDTDDIGRENATIASKWSWHEICRKCLDAVGENQSPVRFYQAK